MQSRHLTGGRCGGATGGTIFSAAPSIEALEPRRLLAAAPNTTAPVDIVGDYSGTAHVVFSPRAFHAPAADAVSMTIIGESSDGAVSGILHDQFGGAMALSGSVRGHGASLNGAGHGISGRLTLHVSADGLMLLGRLDLSMGTAQASARWRGSLELRRQPGVLGFYSRYSGAGAGTFWPTIHALTKPTHTTHKITLTITSQNGDGTATADIEGLPFHGPAIGQVSGGHFNFHFDQRYVTELGAAMSSVSGSISADGRFLTGIYDMEFDDSISYEGGSFRIRVAV